MLCVSVLFACSSSFGGSVSWLQHLVGVKVTLFTSWVTCTPHDSVEPCCNVSRFTRVAVVAIASPLLAAIGEYDPSTETFAVYSERLDQLLKTM